MAVDANFPLLAQAEQTVTLQRVGDNTRVENTVAYTLELGWLGRLIDPILFRPVVKGAAEGFVGSLADRAATRR